MFPSQLSLLISLETLQGRGCFAQDGMVGQFCRAWVNWRGLHRLAWCGRWNLRYGVGQIAGLRLGLGRWGGSGRVRTGQDRASVGKKWHGDLEGNFGDGGRVTSGELRRGLAGLCVT